MPSCCVSNCTNRTGVLGQGKICFFYFPKDPELRQKWMIACGKNEATYNANHGRICQQHFEDKCFIQEKVETKSTTGKSYKMRLKLIPGSIPTKSLILKKPHRQKPRERIPLYTYKELVSALRKSPNSREPSGANTTSFCKDNQRDLLDEQQTLDNLRKELCRLCGQKGSELMPIFEPVSDPSNDVPIYSKIDTYLPIKLNLEDSLPFGICPNCLSVLNLWHDWYTTCIAADAVLWKTFGKESHKKTVSDVPKSEVKQNTENEAEEIPSDSWTDKIPFVTPTDETSSYVEIGGGEDTPTQCVESSQTIKIENKSFKEQFNKSCTYRPILYKCHFCSDLFNKSGDQKNHIAMCSQLSTICELCGHEVSCRKDLKRHKFYKHKVVPPKYSCDKHEKCFKSVCGVGILHENNKGADHSGKYCCKLCGSVFRQDNCHIHGRKHENNTISAFLNEDFHHEMNCGGSESSVVYACPVCQEKFSDMLSLAVHVT